MNDRYEVVDFDTPLNWSTNFWLEVLNQSGVERDPIFLPLSYLKWALYGLMPLELCSVLTHCGQARGIQALIKDNHTEQTFSRPAVLVGEQYQYEADRLLGEMLSNGVEHVSELKRRFPWNYGAKRFGTKVLVPSLERLYSRIRRDYISQEVWLGQSELCLQLVNPYFGQDFDGPKWSYAKEILNRKNHLPDEAYSQGDDIEISTEDKEKPYLNQNDLHTDVVSKKPLAT